MPPEPYWELTLPIPEEASEAVTNFLWELGALGVVEEATPGRPLQVRAFFPGAVDAAGLEAEVRGYAEALAALGIPPSGPPTVAPVADGQWATAWREHFRPVAVGRRLVIAPPWDRPPADDRLVIVIDPGRAFGTGHHGSTAGCLVRLEALVADRRPALVVDVGTGSGILAIAAAGLGAARVLAFDEDPDAVAAAMRNVTLNGLAGRVSCLVANAAEVALDPAPLVLANLLPAAHRTLGPRYAQAVAAGGTLVAGGIPEGEAADVARALAGHGFRQRASVAIDGWTTLELERLGATGRP